MGTCEFGEDCWEPMPRTNIDTEFVVPVAEFCTKACPALITRWMQSFEPPHRPQPGLQPAMISFDWIVGILLHDVAGGGHQLLDRARVGRCLPQLGRCSA